ncbi:unnamed protein product, partial [Coregonus sp. 'balchen']
IAQEQCCSAVVGDTLCTSGINLAKEQGACVVPFTHVDPCETKTTKMCCDCCLLGLMSASSGNGCELALDLGKQCQETAQACCSWVRPEHNKPAAGAQDINECLKDTHNCVTGQSCINTEGSFRCQRDTNCDIDECAFGSHNCGLDFACRNTAGSFRCHPREQCGDGYIQDAVGSCIDINECVTQSSPCQPGQTCINTVGSYTCRRYSVNCGRGYHLSEDGSRCVDINECRQYSGRLCAHKCENTLGSYQCSCTTGFKLASDGRNCEDVNECEMNPCSQECGNVYGSYQCYCRRGYQLSDIDGITCEDTDECALPTGGHVCSYHCSNTPGSFRCTCPPMGYTLAPNGRTCQDINECVAGSHSCAVTESCFNVQGGFRCLSFECPPNFLRAAEGRCERVACEYIRDPLCLSLPLRISFYNITFPTNISVPAKVFRMGPSNSVPGDDIQLDIIAGDQGSFFSAHRLAHSRVISLQSIVTEPRDFLLTVEMRLIRYGTVHLYMAKIAVFITHKQPIPPRLPF